MAALGALMLAGAMIAAVVDHFVTGGRNTASIIVIGMAGILINVNAQMRNGR
jgi:hypothetical protein